MKYIKLFTGTRRLGSMGSTATNGKNHVLPIDSATPTEPKRRTPVNYALRILFASFTNLQICFVLNRSLNQDIMARFFLPHCNLIFVIVNFIDTLSLITNNNPLSDLLLDNNPQSIFHG